MNHRSSAILSPQNYELLQQLMSTLVGSRTALAAILRHKLGAATLTPADDIDPDVVTLGSTVEYRVGETAPPERARLVRARPRNPSGTLSIFEPRGLAMLGIRSGQSISIPGSNGFTETVFVDEVSTDDGPVEPDIPGSSVVAFSRARPGPRRHATPVSLDEDPGPSAA